MRLVLSLSKDRGTSKVENDSISLLALIRKWVSKYYGLNETHSEFQPGEET